jgi:hypothetical protein
VLEDSPVVVFGRRETVPLWWDWFFGEDFFGFFLGGGDGYWPLCGGGWPRVEEAGSVAAGTGPVVEGAGPVEGAGLRAAGSWPRAEGAGPVEGVCPCVAGVGPVRRGLALCGGG